MIENLKELNLITVLISWGATAFEFEGKKGDDYHRYTLSTMFEICFDEHLVFKSDILQDESTVKIWNYFNKRLLDIVLSSDGRSCELKFEDELSIYVWSKEMDHDSLFIVNRYQSEEWFAIG